MALGIDIKRPTIVHDVGELVRISVNNGQPSVLAPEKLDEKTWYILAFKDGKVVGGIGSILYGHDSHHANRAAEIDILAVEKPFREQGLEDLLLKRMLEDLAALKIGTIRAIVEDDEIELYFRNGFRHDPRDLNYMVHDLRY